MVEVIEMIDDDVYNVKAKIELNNIYKELDQMFCTRETSTTS